MDIKFDVNEVLQKIADGLGVAVEKLYPILYKQAIIQGIINLFWITFIIAIVIAYPLAVRVMLKRIKREKEKVRRGIKVLSDTELEWAFIVFGGIGFVIAFFVSAWLLKETATAFLNTDYYIIQDILKKLRASGG